MGINLRNLRQYKLQTCLKSTGRVEIWKAIDTSLRCYVTLKLIHASSDESDPGFLARFTHQTKVIRNLHHPNIVRIHDTHIALPPESENPIGYIVMEYFEGPTLVEVLHDLAQTGRNMSATDLVHLYKAICSAIDFVHQKDVIHGNIQPANILLRNYSQLHFGEPALTCLGTARLLGTSQSVLCLWGNDVPWYLSPEQCQGKPATVQSDIYALGALLYEFYTGMPPFQGNSSSAIMLQHSQASPKPPILIKPAMSPGVSKIILRCLEKNPEQRFGTASALALALADALLPSLYEVPVPTLIRPTRAIDKAYMAGVQSSKAPTSTKYKQTPKFRPTRTLIPYTAPFSSPLLGKQTLASQSTQVVNTAPLSSPVARVDTATGSWKARSEPNTEEIFQRTILDKTVGIATQVREEIGRPFALLMPTLPVTFSSSLSLTLIHLRRFMGNIQQSMPHPSTRMRVVLYMLFAVAFICSSLGTYLLMTSSQSSLPLPAVGKVSFVSSGLVEGNGKQGMNDEVLIDLHDLALPGTSKSYYAWLLSDAGQTLQHWVLLGKLHLNHGNAYTLFNGDKKHSDLLAQTSRFLVTEEDMRGVAHNPFLHQNIWRYYAQLPQQRSTTDSYHFSMLDHVRYLLVQAPELLSLGLKGSLNTWLLRNMAEVSRWSIEMRDHWNNASSIRNHLSDILYSLDGNCTPAGVTHRAVNAAIIPGEPTINGSTYFPLFEPCLQKAELQMTGTNNMRVPGDDLDHILFHITGILQSPGITLSMQSQAEQIAAAIHRVQGWLNQMQRDAKALMRMTDKQLLMPPAVRLLSNLMLQARYAYAGQLDPLTGNMLGGAVYIYDSIQSLATFDVSPYS
jgi:eukaryotic-like serine/threonine-protein kinase